MKTAEDLKRLIEANCNDGDVRLVGGTSPLNGRVEVCYHNQWGGVCSRYTWSQNQATVVCRQLGYLYDAVAYSSGYGDATTTFLIVDGCDVSADQLLACYSYGNGRSPSTLGYYTCSGYNNFVVNCTQPIPEYCSGTCTNGSIRLVGGPSPYKGRLELYDYNLCNHNGDVGVHCAAPTSTCLNGDARLVNGSTPLEGRVEVCIGQQWGAVCGDYYWTSDTSGANTVCEQLGYSPSNATAYVYSYFGSYKGGIFVLDVHCDATADKLVDCSFYYQSVYHFCYDGSTAGVRCQGMPTSVCTDGTVRLAGDLTPYEGRVEVCAHGTWGTVCSNHWDIRDASVVCSQLGYKAAGVFLYVSSQYGPGPVWLNNVNCIGVEQQLIDCPVISNNEIYCYHYNDAVVQCTATVQNCTDWDIRLVGGSEPLQGRVEIIPLTLDYNVKLVPLAQLILSVQVEASDCQCLDGDVRLVNGTNGTIGPGIIEGMVEIFMVASGVWSLGQDIVPAGNITFSQFYCAGYEKKILDCYHDPPGYYDNGYNFYVAVRCQASCYQCQDGTIRLVNGNSSYEGRVEVCEGGCWGPVCIGDSGWSSLDAAVVCNQLTMGSQGAVPRYYYSLTSPPMLAPHCTGYESSLFNCAQSVCHIENYNYAGVECSPVDELLHRMDFYIGKLSNSLTE
eukprot:Em0237g5a